MWTTPDDELARITDYLAGELTPEEMAATAHWIADDPERHALLQELRRSQVALRRMRAERTDVDAIVRAVTTRAAASPTPRTMGWAARARSSGMSRVAAVAAAIVVGVLGFSIVQHVRGPGSEARRYHTGVAERLKVSLPDGSMAVLAPESELQVTKDFGGASRTVTLRGEALFTVTHSVGTPFTVRTGAVQTRVLGTSFSVRRYPQDSVTQLVVAQGRIAVGAAVFGTGDIATVANDGQIAVSRGNAVTEQLAWAEGRLVFSGTPLRDAIPVLERWYGVTIDVTDPVLLDRRVTTTLGPESAARAMELIAFTVEGRATLQGSHVVIRSH